MTTLIIQEDTPQAKKFIEYAKTLPFVEEKKEKRSFRAAVAECGAISVDAFFDELDERLKNRYRG